MKIFKDLFGGTNTEKIEFSLVFFLIYIQYSLWFLQFNSVIQILMTSIIIGILIIRRSRNFKVNFKLLLFFLFVSSLISLSCLVNNSFGINDAMTIINWIYALLICSLIDFSSFTKAYVKVITLFALSGVIIFLSSLISPQFFSSFPILNTEIWTGNSEIRNAFLGAVNITSNYQRNFGIFYEPGLFAFHLNLAIFLHLYLGKEIKVRMLIILAIGVLTTMSTNGYITFILIFFSYFISKKDKVSKRISRRIIGLFTIVICVAVLILYFNENLWIFLTSKLTEFDSSQTTGSGVDRWNAMKKSFGIFLENPIFGKSQHKFANLLDGQIATFTPFNWFAQYGLIYGIICNTIFLSLALFKHDNIWALILRLGALVTLVMSQNVSSYLVIFIIVFYIFIFYFCKKSTKEKISIEEKGKKIDFNNSAYL